MAAVEIIVLNWNNAEDTLKCLSSVMNLEYADFSVTVVDNGSSDCSPECIGRQFPSAKLLRLPANVGFAAGNNFGIADALNHVRRPDYFFLLNNDTLVAPDMLAQLVRFAENNSKAGLVGPAIYCMDIPHQLFAAGGLLHWPTGVALNRGILQYSAQKVDYLPGCGILARREVFETAGGLDPEYYLNFEDVEWALRARRCGFEVWCLPQAKMWHKISATLGRASPMNTYYMTRNSLRFFWMNAPVHWRLAAVSAIGLRTIRTILAWTFRSRYGEGFKKRRSANLLAVRDFLLGRFGEMGPDVATACR